MIASLMHALVLSQSLLANGSFELMRDDRPEGWRTQSWAGRASFSAPSQGRSGSRCVLIESAEGADAAWQATVVVKPFSKYRIIGHVKTEGVSPVANGIGALLNVHGRPEKSQAVTGTQDWTPLEILLDTGADDVLQINLLLGYYGTARGKAWFDDVSIELLETRELKPQAVIDATKTFEPISKYIYSQFIEHLGRCIYGGIWAEMLEDRKFYYPIEGKEPYATAREGYQRLVASPWDKQGSATLSRVQSDYRRQPVIELKGVLRQPKLWIEKDREYVAKITYRGGAVSTSMHSIVAEYGKKLHPASERWTTASHRFKAGETMNDAFFVIYSKEGTQIAAVSLMPADNVEGFRADTLALLKELNAPLYRWPGGNFVSGYEWRDGIGERDKRPTIPNPAWSGIDTNDVGTHEFIRFCELIETEPLIVVNTGFGDPHSGAAWVEYCNGSDQTPMGALRKRNGSAKPFSVKWWGIGNEMYGNWQLGHIPVGQYVVKHNLFYDRMKAVDPTIKTIASSDLGGGWSRRMLTDCRDQMDLISEHFYCQEKPGIMAHVAQIPNAIRGKVAAHRQMRDTMPGLKEKGIKIAMDEWNYWYGPYVYGELGTRYFVKDGLGIAAGLHEFFRSTDIVEMAQYAQTVNVIGCIKTTPTAAAFETTGLVLKLYRQHFGTIPVAVEGSPEPLDVSAALTPDKRFLTIGVVNPTGESVKLPLSIRGAEPLGAVEGWTITHPDPMAFNTPGEEPAVAIAELRPDNAASLVKIGPYSVSLLRLQIRM